MADAGFWTTRITSGNQDSFSVPSDTRQVIITAISGDIYISPQSGFFPPALDDMTADHWTGAVLLEGNTLRMNLRIEDLGVSDGELYFGPVTPSSGSCILSVVSSRQED